MSDLTGRPPPSPQGDTNGARKMFEAASRLRCNGRPSIAAQLALANLSFSQRNFAEALKM